MNIIIGLIVISVLASIGLTILGFGLSLIFGLLALGWTLCSSIFNRLRYGTWDKPGKDLV